MSKGGNRKRRDYLKRLPPEYYRGDAAVHWSMTINERRTGWLNPTLHGSIREILTHAMFRFGLSCPIYCCMPDHIHLLWIGLFAHSDQLLAAKYFRKHLNAALEEFDTCLQTQGYDHVLKNEERKVEALETVAEYIARNPERAGLIRIDAFHEYPYTGCLVPCYPDLRLWQSDSWNRLWRACSYVRKHGLMHRNFNDD